MLKEIADGVVDLLREAGINAVYDFTGRTIDDSKSTVCISVKSARISASGLGSYIGVCTENGQIKEMYGERAELTLSVGIYCPLREEEDCTALAEQVRCALWQTDALSVTEFEMGSVGYDKDTLMLRRSCTVKAHACLVREKRGTAASAYGIGEANV